MKSQYFFVRLVTVSLFFATASLADLPIQPRARGGDHSGGGDVQRSSVSDVIKAVKSVAAEPTDRLWSMNRSGYWIETPSVYRDFFDLFVSYLAKDFSGAVAESLFGSRDYSNKFFDTPIYQDLKRTKVMILTKGECPVSGPGEENRAASTGYHPGAPICINANALKSLPKADLVMQIRALLAHEFMHHFGFGEKEAMEIQNRILINNHKTVATAYEKLSYSLTHVQRTFVRLQRNSKNQALNDAALCMDIGLLLGIYQNVQDLDDALSVASKRELGIDRSEFSDAEWLTFTHAMKDIASFCGNYYQISGQWTTGEMASDPAKVGNRDHLRSSLDSFKRSFIDMYERITKLEWYEL